MDMIVCMKRVPETGEAEITVDSTGKEIVRDRLTYDINESDNYALEEAVLLKEEFGGTVTLISIGAPDTDEALKMGLAKGGDVAIRLWDPRFVQSDAYATAFILAKAIKEMNFDLVLTGCMATDDGWTQVGATLAGLLGIPHATLVIKTDIKENSATVQSELEGGLIAVNKVKIPALFTIQTGINEPRYASLISIKRAAGKEIKVTGLEDLGLDENRVGEQGSKTSIVGLTPPPVGKRAAILEGTPEEVSGRLAEIFKEKGMI